MRQAREWGRNYIFWSCADVDVVRPRRLTDERACLGRGRRNRRTGEEGWGELSERLERSCTCTKYYRGCNVVGTEEEKKTQR